MAKHDSAPAVYDGRFGREFDDEISSGAVWKIMLGLAVVCAGYIFLMVFFEDFLVARVEQRTPPPSPVTLALEPALPPSPRLQVDPEGELEALRHQMQARLSGYGWIDEHAGVVHIPIDRAIDLVARQGVASTTPAHPEDHVAETGIEGAVEHVAPTPAAAHGAAEEHGG